MSLISGSYSRAGLAGCLLLKGDMDEKFAQAGRNEVPGLIWIPAGVEALSDGESSGRQRLFEAKRRLRLQIDIL